MSESVDGGVLANLSAVTLSRLERYYERDFTCLKYSYSSTARSTATGTP